MSQLPENSKAQPENGQGTITRVRGSDIEFASGRLPTINDAMMIELVTVSLSDQRPPEES
jgi:hypothetical protein